MKPICAELHSIWKSGPGEHTLIIQFDDDRVKDETRQFSFHASDTLGLSALKKGDHLQIAIRKVQK